MIHKLRFWVVTILRWFLGIISLLLSVPLIAISFFASLSLVLLSILLIPPFERKLSTFLLSLKKPILLNIKWKILIAVVLFFSFFGFTVAAANSLPVSKSIKQSSVIQPSPATSSAEAQTEYITPVETTITPSESSKLTVTATPTNRTSKCVSVNGLPDSICTPGSIDQRVTQENIQQTICTSGYTSTVRPSTSYTNNLKAVQITQYGYQDTNLSDYEEDHLIPLELGGNPTDPNNLWPEYGTIPNKKDTVENGCKTKVCNGAITLAEAQKEIAADWRTACGYNITVTLPTPSVVSPTSTSGQTQQSSSIPTGATGICNDGTYTYAENHQGACSHHGGVKNWL